MRHFMVRFFHKISPSAKDVAGPISISEAAIDDGRLKLAAALRKVGVLAPGATIRQLRRPQDRPGTIVIFPSLPGSTTYWHAIELTPAAEGPDHVVFHVAEGSHVGWQLGNITGSDPLRGKSPEKVIASRFARIKRLYPSVRTKEVLPWGGSEGAFTRHKAGEHSRKMREEAMDLWRSIREREGATDGFTVSGLRDRVRILEEGIRKMQPYVEAGAIGAAEWQHGWKRELPGAIDRLAYFEERARKHERGENPSVSGRVSPRRAAVIERSYQAIEKAREAHDPKRFKRGGGYSVEEQRAIARAAGLKKAPSNVALGRLELHRFTTERPSHLFAYYKGGSPKSGEAITNFTGEKLGHVVSTGSIYHAGSGYPRTRMLPVRVRAITGDVYAGVANLDTGSYVKLKKVGSKASAAKHESGGNPRTTASDMALKAKVKALVGKKK